MPGTCGVPAAFAISLQEGSPRAGTAHAQPTMNIASTAACRIMLSPGKINRVGGDLVGRTPEPLAPEAIEKWGIFVFIRGQGLFDRISAIRRPCKSLPAQAKGSPLTESL